MPGAGAGTGWTVAGAVAFSISAEEVLRLSAALEAGSSHPLALAILAGAWAMAGSWHLVPAVNLHGFDPVLGALWAVGMVCAVAAAWSARDHRLSALILMGGTGLVTCMSFIWLSAPDLAVTQLLVEIVTTALILLGLRWLPKREGLPPRKPDAMARYRRTRDLLIAVLSGTGLAGLAYFAMLMPRPPSSTQSYPKP